MNHQEIERKFLAQESAGAAAAEWLQIHQGYLVTNDKGEEVRVRSMGAAGWWLTYKCGRGKVRREHEVALSVGQFETLWPATEGKRLTKRRGLIDIGVPAFLDVYQGALASLCTVEVEFETVAECDAFEPPAWFGAEITEDLTYKARILVVNGLPASR
jgi:CYTH domain-containing protein